MYVQLAWLIWPLACNKPEPSAESPIQPVEQAASSSASNAATVALTPAKNVARVDLDAEFHRSRVGAGRGYWVLGVVHNPHSHAVTDARAHVRMLDAEGKLVGEAEAGVERVLAADARAAVAVRVDEPVEHEQLELRASALPSQTEPAAPPSLTLEHEPPQRAELGGWFVRGTVSNTGSATVEGARLEVQGLDKSGRLLGVDWLVIAPVAAGAVVEFDLGELRYEQAPARFEIALIGAPEPMPW
jgi:hypothetical protein